MEITVVLHSLLTSLRDARTQEIDSSVSNGSPFKSSRVVITEARYKTNSHTGCNKGHGGIVVNAVDGVDFRLDDSSGYIVAFDNR